MMPENENIPSQKLLPAPPVVKKKPSWKTPWFPLALLALLLSGWQWLETRHRLNDVQQELSRQQAEDTAGDQEARGAQKALREQVDALQARLGAVDGKLNEFQAQGAALQSLLQDVSRSREEATLIEVEQAITLAGQQLQLAGNVPIAILALQTADSRLARLDRPLYQPLRKAVAKDLERLNAVPVVDVSGISLHLEQIVLSADKLPLASLGRLAVKPDAAQSTETLSWWQRVSGSVWNEIKGLVRVQRFDREEPVLLAPGQEFFLRENLRLRLLNARLALLAHDQATFSGDLKVAQDWLTRHFDGNDKAVQAAQASLAQVSAAKLNLALPTLNDSSAALRALRDTKEKR